MASVISTHLGHCSKNATTGSEEMKEHDCVSIKLYVEEQVAI